MNTRAKESVGQRLLRARSERNWSQATLAQMINTTVQNINRWEHDKTLPHPHHREALCNVFEKSPQALFDLAQPEKNSLLWNVRHARNLYFTGREEVFARLHAKFLAQSFTQPYALNGLGGMGKTQIAVEYAYRYSDEYTAILWVQADYRELLLAEMVALAALLQLPEKNQADETKVVAAVMHWLESTPDWLLILDNADDIEMAFQFLPSRSKGHILLTTRSQATGQNIKNIEIEKMGREEGALFLLRRAKLLDDDASLAQSSATNRKNAEAICEIMDGLPLALDQAAAYIDENKGNLQDYLNLYQSRRSDLLHRRGAFNKHDYPKPVATTWSLSFEQMEQARPSAANLLRLCAFLHPEDIPEEMIVRGASELAIDLQAILTDPFSLAETIGELRKYSFVQRNAETRSLTIHRLVQVILKDEMNPQMRHQWANQVIRMLNHAFPEVEFENRSTCQLYLPHVQTGAALIAQEQITSPEATHLLNRAGKFLFERGQYAEAEPFLRQALAIREQEMGAQHPEIAQVLHDLATLYRNHGRYEQSEELFLRAFVMRKQTLGEDHPLVADTLNALAALHWYKGQYEQSHLFYQTSLSMLERLLPSNDPKIAAVLNNLALLYWEQGKYRQAEQTHKRALAIREHMLGPMHPSSAISFNNIGLLYWKLGRYTEAETYLQRALENWETGLDSDHPNTATALNNLGRIYLDQGNYAQAETFLQRSLAIRERKLGPHHPHTAYSFNNLGRIYHEQGQYQQAEVFYSQALTVREQHSNYPDLAETLADLAKWYYDTKQYEKAATRFAQAITMREQYQGVDHPDLVTTLQNYAALLDATGHFEEALQAQNRSRRIREQLEQEFAEE